MLNNLSLVILSYNRIDELKKNLPIYCLLLENFNIEIIIVDNLSLDGSREYLQDLASSYSDIVLVFNDSNLGVGGGRNSGRKFATKNYVLHIDDDTYISVEDMVALCELMRDDPLIGVISPKIVHPQTFEIQNDHGVALCELGNYHGSCHLVRRDAMQVVGDIDPLCTFGGEELDYSIRMRKFGYKVIYAPFVKSYHNSYTRNDHEARWRRCMRVYNFSRLHFKHFPLHNAILFSSRYLTSHLVSGIRYFGLNVIFSLIQCAIKGAFHGRKSYSSLPRNVVKFYINHNILPDFGNVPFSKKILNKIRTS